MADTADVFAALFERASTLTVGSPVLPIAFPEPKEAFVPPANGQYLEVQVLTNRPAWEGLGEGTIDQGLLQITVVWPKNLGLLAPTRIADQVRAHFPKSLRMFSGAARVTVSQKPLPPVVLTEANDVRLAITIPWLAT